MFDRSNIVVGLEVGTSKVCAVVGEINAQAALNIVGVGQSRSRGVRKGEIVDQSAAGEDIRAAITEAEQMADAEIRSVYLGVTGGHVRSLNNRGTHPIVSQDREITVDDVADVTRNARAVNLPQDHHVLHAVRQHFHVDGRSGLTDPVGMLGSRLAVDIHVVHGNFNRLQNAVRAVKSLNLEVDSIVFNGIASALATLSNEHKELGALVIDIGGGTTEYIVYADGIIKHTGVLAVGGDHVSNDLAYGLKLPLRSAEQLKVEHGGAFLDDSVSGRTVPVLRENGLPEHHVNLEHLRRIMALRIEEILDLVMRDVTEAGLIKYLRAGVLLCGGGAHIPGIAKLAQDIFGTPVQLGRTASISGNRAALDQPEFATAIGLAKFASMQEKKKRSSAGLADSFKSKITGIFGRKA